MRSKLKLCKILAGLILICSGTPSLAEEYPARPITLVVPFAAGGPTDIVARILGEQMSKTLGRKIVVENVVGGGGTTATIQVIRAAPNGYTIEMGNTGTHAAAVALNPDLTYNPAVDFEPIGLSAGMPVLILARNDFPAADLKQFVAYVKANGEKLSMAHAGIGSVSFTACLLLNSIINVKPASVPYNGTGPAMNALIAGQVDYMCDQTPNVVSEVARGTVKAYALAGPLRNSALPNVPTAKQAGLPEFQVSAWNALFAPKGTPKDILDKLTQALDEALSDPTTRNRLLELGGDIPDPSRRGQQALATLVKSEIEHWKPIIRAAGLLK